MGTWVAGIPTDMKFEKGMENEIAMPKKKRVYKIVSVIQPPFINWNETTRKIVKLRSRSRSGEGQVRVRKLRELKTQGFGPEPYNKIGFISFPFLSYIHNT